MDETTRKYHEVANIFPLLRGAEFEELKQDIVENGQLEDIVIDAEGKIIDGRNRHRACIEAGIQPRFTTFAGDSVISYVLSKNLHRRHLTSSQAATAAVEALDFYEEEAKERQATSSGGSEPQLTQRIAEADKGEAREKAAKDFGTNRQYVSDAKKLKEETPDLFEEVKEGSKSIPQAKREVNKRNRPKINPPESDDKYRVIYADPPWKYNDSGVINESDGYGRAERHYPTMTITEICDLPIKELGQENSVLFLWTTSPLLEDAFKIVKAWGYKYKTSFVWDKVKHNFGHYNSVRHEMLLVCTRGSCTPDNLKLFDSVQSIERSDTHSEKPEEFRSIIDTLYTHGKKIELFSRKKNIAGWEVWGNEPA